MPWHALRATEYEIKVLLTLAGEAQLHFAQLAADRGWPEESDFDEDRSLTDVAALAAGSQLVVQIALEHLNVMVDSAVFVVRSALREDDEPTSQKDLARSRRENIEALEAYAACKVDSLPGWSEVEELRLDVNALKHRVGIRQVMPYKLDFGDGDPLHMSKFIGVDPSLELLERRADGVLCWMSALTECLMKEKHKRRDARRRSRAEA